MKMIITEVLALKLCVTGGTGRHNRFTSKATVMWYVAFGRVLLPGIHHPSYLSPWNELQFVVLMCENNFQLGEVWWEVAS